MIVCLYLLLLPVTVCRSACFFIKNHQREMCTLCYVRTKPRPLDWQTFCNNPWSHIRYTTVFKHSSVTAVKYKQIKLREFDLEYMYKSLVKIRAQERTIKTDKGLCLTGEKGASLALAKRQSFALLRKWRVTFPAPTVSDRCHKGC